jgi:hypothetical protein
MCANQARSRGKSTNLISMISMLHNFLSLRTPLLEFHPHCMVAVEAGLWSLLQLLVTSVHFKIPQVGLAHIILMQAALMGKVASVGAGYQESPDNRRRT